MPNRVAVFTVLLVLGACTEKVDTNSPQPNGPIGLVTVDSVRLTESDSLRVDQPGGLAVTADGRIIVADNASKQLVVFDGSGAPLVRMGRQGSGPGEFESVGAVTLMGDSLIAVKNMARGRVEVFSLSGQRYAWGRAIPGRAYDLAFDNGTLSQSVLSPVDGYSVLSVRDSMDAPRKSGAVPKLYRDAPMLAGPFGTVAHARRGPMGIQVFEGSNYIFFQSDSTGKTDSISLPVLRRRGAKTEALTAIARDTSRGMDALYKSSIPTAVAFVNDSVAVVVHTDVDLEKNAFTGRTYVSLVDIRRYRVCLDLPLAVPGDPLPRIALRDSTVYALTEHVNDDGTGGAWVVRSRLDLGICPWNYVQKH